MDTKPPQCCRGCLMDLTSSEIFSFQLPGIKELFEKCTNLDVSSRPDESHLPSSICFPCYSQCQRWLKFRDKCHENDRIIHCNAFEGSTTSSQDANREESVKEQEAPDPVAALPPVDIKQEPESEFEDETFEDTKMDTVESDPLDLRELQVLNLTTNALVEGFNVKEEVADVVDDNQQDTAGCPFCRSKLPEGVTLREHVQEHISEENPQCPLCNERFNRSSDVYSHLLALHVEHPWNGRNSGSVERNREPKSNHVVVKIYKRCPLCFEKVSSLYHHLSEEHVNPGDTRCPICFTNCLATHLLKSHLVEHTDERPFSCEICFKTFKLKYQLVTHVVRGEHPCLLCKRVFSDTTDMKAHLAWHSANDPEQIDKRTKMASLKRPPLCPLCPKGGKLTTEHLKSHVGPGDKKCPICGIRCKRTAYLKVHLMMHTGERNFACEFCDARFNQRWSLVLHLQRHHPHSSDEDEPFGSEPRQLGVNMESKPSSSSSTGEDPPVRLPRVVYSQRINRCSNCENGYDSREHRLICMKKK